MPEQHRKNARETDIDRTPAIEAATGCTARRPADLELEAAPLKSPLLRVRKGGSTARDRRDADRRAAVQTLRKLRAPAGRRQCGVSRVIERVLACAEPAAGGERSTPDRFPSTTRDRWPTPARVVAGRRSRRLHRQHAFAQVGNLPSHRGIRPARRSSSVATKL